MNFFAPNLIPEHHMHSALISPEEFYAGIGNLKPTLPVIVEPGEHEVEVDQPRNHDRAEL